MKNGIVAILLFLLTLSSGVFAETYYDAYKNIFGGQLAKKYPNAATSKVECEKMMREYAKNYSTLNRTNEKKLGSADMLVEMYCNAPKQYVKKRVGYHDTDDKSDFWIPAGVEPLMMSNDQLEQYRIIDINTNKNYDFNNQFSQYQIKKAKSENRPLIGKDMVEALDDEHSLEMLKKALAGGGIVTGYDPRNGYGTKFVPLSNDQEKELTRLTDKYGEGIYADDDKFKKNLSLYRERQEYMKKNQAKTILQNTLKSLF